MYRYDMRHLSSGRDRGNYRMTFKAIAVKPENALVVKMVLDMVIMDYATIDKDYIVDGFDPPMTYQFYTKEEFNREWRFVLGQEHEGQFSLIMAR